MALINKQEVLQELQEGLRLDTAREKTPKEVADKILPTYEVNPRPRIFHFADGGSNDSDKTITVPTGKKWKILSLLARLETTATVGNRRIQLRIDDTSANAIFIVSALNVQAASLNEDYNFIHGIDDSTETNAGIHFLPFPPEIILLEDFSIRIFDSAVVDAAADDLRIRMTIEEEDLYPLR